MLVGFFLILPGCSDLGALKDYLVDQAVGLIPHSADKQLGQTAKGSLRLNAKLTDLTKEPIKELTADLVNVLEEKSSFQAEIHLSYDAAVNAFALPGGIVVLNRGFVEFVESPEELQGVVAHELAHVSLRHGMEKLVSTLGLYLILQTAFGDVTGLVGILLDNSHLLLQQAYSRDLEREADEVGFQYLVAAGKSPKGLMTFFRRMKEKNQTSGHRFLEFLSSHPADDSRVEHIESLISQQKRLPEVSKSDLAAFENLRKIVRGEQL